SADATTVVDIQGSGFSGATGVLFSNKPSPFVSVNDDGEITALVPVGATSGKITVVNPAGPALSAGTFTVRLAPVVKSALGPANTPVAKAGDTVTLTGSNFITGMGAFTANHADDMFVNFAGDGNSSSSLS